MASFEQRTTARALPSVLWDVALDVAEYPTFLRYVDAVEILTPGPLRSGYRWRENRRINGRSRQREVMVESLDEYRRIRVEGSDDTVRYALELRFEPIPAAADGSPQTDLVVECSTLSVPGPMVQQVADTIAEPFRMRRLNRELLADAQDIASEAERRQL